uniref:Uncharacterized protein n=1 Tax=Utricularia reniformis TaxID=192314 RepID=A0A1Y0AYT2_9LAMI|nr:hypothetical protein AEK19_MT0803 [Utricularia reniformis]ART30314.1 hypothetical protein AEK19_MT0803 [Utricularia reniformis]
MRDRSYGFAFDYQSSLVSREMQEGGGYHLHAGPQKKHSPYFRRRQCARIIIRIKNIYLSIGYWISFFFLNFTDTISE